MQINQYPDTGSATIYTVTDDSPLLAAYNGNILRVNKATAVTITVPAGLGAGFNCLIIQVGAGQVTMAASGTTINNRQGFTKSAGQWGVITVVSDTTDHYVTSGDMAA